MSKIIKVIEGEGILEQEYGEKLRKIILEEINQDVDGILLDFTNISFMNSSGLGILASTYTIIKKKKKELFLCSLNGQIAMIFELTSMDSCFKIYKDKETFNQEKFLEII
jgi:anti-anti-sigma factor